ncbi:MAG: glutamate--tRNA ligase [Gammaproteobacteria bacterium]|nr:glutamate--tRNA ligase [Gammaproteobacteria bacterium]
MLVRTRFAPSPTGFLHIGGARTALFCWLYTRRHHGKFILRIEDTDLVRSTPESVQAILDGMAFLGLDYDEGPFYQTQRIERYKQVVQQLLDEGKAYRCYCSKERLEALRECQLAAKEKPRYDQACRNLVEFKNCPYVIRFKNPDKGEVSFKDLVHGELTFKNSELDDLVIARGDGMPTYNFSVVVDDMDMGITHVIRGDGHINNTPRQINIFKALNVKIPVFAHLPEILEEGGKQKLSKRRGAASVMQYRDDGFLPQALLNYLVRLGWSHGDQEIFSADEMIQYFDLKKVHSSPAALNQQKLLWLNQHYLKSLNPEEVAKHLKWHMDDQIIDITSGPDLTEVVKAQAERCKTLKEMAEKSRYFYEDFKAYDEKAAKKFLTPQTLEILQLIYNQLEEVISWKAEKIHEIITKASERLELNLGKIAQPIRVAVTGGTISPPIDVTLELLGREKTLERLHRAIERGL